MDGEVLAVSMQEAGRLIGVCKRTITNLVNARQLASRKIGRRRLIPMSAIQSFLRHDHETKLVGDVRAEEW
jgi:excisionase family DNA binding protein